MEYHKFGNVCNAGTASSNIPRKKHLMDFFVITVCFACFTLLGLMKDELYVCQFTTFALEL